MERLKRYAMKKYNAIVEQTIKGSKVFFIVLDDFEMLCQTLTISSLQETLKPITSTPKKIKVYFCATEFERLHPSKYRGDQPQTQIFQQSRRAGIVDID